MASFSSTGQFANAKPSGAYAQFAKTKDGKPWSTVAASAPKGWIPGVGVPKKKKSSSSGSSKSSKPEKSAAEKAAEKQADILEKAAREQKKLRDQQYSSTDKAFAELINSLSGRYSNYKDQTKSSYDEDQAAELQNLQARQMAYGTADSEQRDQAQERLSTTYANKFASFLKSLAEDEASQRATLGTQRSSALNDILNNKASDAYNIALQQMAAKQQAWSNSMAEQQLARSGSGSGTASKVGAYINALATDKLKGAKDNPYATPGIRESIAQQAANQFGGSALDYYKYMPDGFEEMYATGRETNPTTVPLGGSLIDANSGRTIYGSNNVPTKTPIYNASGQIIGYEG